MCTLVIGNLRMNELYDSKLFENIVRFCNFLYRLNSVQVAFIINFE